MSPNRTGRLILGVCLGITEAFAMGFFLFTWERLNQLQVVNSPGYFDNLMSLGGLVVQPWLFLAVWLTESGQMDYPYSRLHGTIVISSLSALLMVIVIPQILRWFPRTFWWLALVLTFLTLGSLSFGIRNALRIHDVDVPRGWTLDGGTGHQ